MKVLFLICNFADRNTGVGGHFRSTKTIAYELRKHCNVETVCVGDQLAPPLNGSEINLRFIKCSWYKWMLNYSIIVNEILKNEPNIVVTVGDSASLIAGEFCSKKDVRLVNVKPGGSSTNLKVYTSKFQIHFSPKDRDAQIKRIFQDNSVGKECIVCIPNRVTPFTPNPRLQNSLSKILTSEKPLFSIGHVARFNQAKLQVHLATINVVRKLRLARLPVRAVILGVDSNSKILQEVLNEKHEDDLVITDKELVKDGKQLCFLVDAMVGMGRSLMEAASSGLPVLCKPSNLKIPILLTSENFDKFQHENFSDRAIIEIDEQIELQKLKNLILDTAYYNRLSGLFTNQFNVCEAIPHYLKFFEKVMDSSLEPTVTCVNLKYLLAKGILADLIKCRFKRLITLIK